MPSGPDFRENETLKTLLLIKPGSFGDVIHALPCVAAIRASRPECRISWLIDRRWEPLLADNPDVTETIAFPRENFRGLMGKLRSLPWIWSLRRLQPDVALDLQGLLRTGLMAWMSRARETVGLSDAREGAPFFHRAVARTEPDEHAVRRYLRPLALLGIPAPVTPVFRLPAGSPPASAPTEPYILLHPFARGAGKSLSPDAVAAFALAVAPHRVVIVGNGTLTAPLPPNAINLLGATTLSELIWLIRHAAFVVSVDSGPMHIAAAVTDRLLSIHTWSDPRLVGPFNENAWIWQGGEIRRQQLDHASLPAARSPGPDDVNAIAQFVGREMADGR